MKKGFLGSSKKEPADSRTIRAVIPNVIAVAEMNDFDLSREWYDWVGQDPFQGLPHQDPRNHIEELEVLVSRSEQNEGWEDIERAFWRTLRSAHSTGSGLDMNSGWRTGGLKGRTKVAEGLRYSRLQLVLDMTHKSTKRRFSSRCLI
ncbi:hypothetical protein DY000_02021949 [Brassica cretica]|uniref:Uncharacterized protein n=1 Tax=Brassica cretica TaxID=69181 RepID=A0ABQ7ECX9_BRACR|nr:hypothetical protein DY000_02021949 [Brassica cretica]